MHFWPPFAYVRGLRIDYLSPTVYLTDILAAALIIVCLFTVKSSGKIKITNLIAVLIFFATAGLNIYSSRSPQVSLYKWLKVLELTFIFIISRKILNIKNIKPLIAIFFIQSIVILISALGQIYRQSALGGFWYWLGERSFNIATPGIATAVINGYLYFRPYSFFSHPNQMAGYFLISGLIIFSWQEFVFKNEVFRKLIYIEVLISFLIILLSLSRSALAVFVCSIVALHILNHPGVFRYGLRRNYGAAVIAALAMFTFFLPTLYFRFGALFSSDKYTILNRRLLNQEAIKYFYHSPLAGIGLGNFSILSADQQFLGNSFYLIGQPVHNIFLLLLAETGIIGMTAFFYILFLTAKRLWRFHSPQLIIFLAIFFLGLFDHYLFTLQQTQMLLAFTFGLFWSRLVIAKPATYN